MAKRKQTYEADSVFFLKILLYFLLGSLWVHLGLGDRDVSLPVGLVLGLWFAHHDQFQIDRKIEYALLLVAAVLSYFFPIGFVLAL